MEKVEAILCDNDRGIILTHGEKERVHQAYIELSTVYEMNHLPNNLQVIEIKEWLRGYYQTDEQLKQLTENMIQLSYECHGFLENSKDLLIITPHIVIFINYPRPRMAGFIRPIVD